jgi:hypothetical protein
MDTVFSYGNHGVLNALTVDEKGPSTGDTRLSGESSFLSGLPARVDLVFFPPYSENVPFSLCGDGNPQKPVFRRRYDIPRVLPPSPSVQTLSKSGKKVWYFS